MIRIVWLGILCAVLSTAQQKPASPLAALRETAQQKASEWDTLAQDLESRISHLLPCDPRVGGAIDEVSRASEARLFALRQYLEADRARAKNDAEASDRFIATQNLLKGELNAERAEAEQERIAIEGLLVEAGESVKRRAPLEEARKILDSIAGMTAKRDAQTQAEVAESDALGGALADLAALLKTRETAIETEVRGLDAETPRWHEYYVARLARAQAECAMINPQAGAARRPTRRTKQ